MLVIYTVGRIQRWHYVGFRARKRVGRLWWRIVLCRLGALLVETDGVLLKVKFILRMSPHEYQQILMNVLMGVGFLILLFSCHNTLSPVGRTLVQMVLMENGNTVDEVNAEGVVGPTSCFSNTTQEPETSDKVCPLDTVIDCTRFSTLKRLVSVTGYVMRFIGNIRKRLEKRTDIITELCCRNL